MLRQKDFNTMWDKMYDSFEFVANYSQEDWDDDLGTISITYDLYEYKGVITMCDTDVYFHLECKSYDNGNTFCDIEVNDYYIENGDEDLFEGWDNYDSNGALIAMDNAFEKAAKRK